MDGNNRWAKKNGLLGPQGHAKGADRVKELVKNCLKCHISVLTVFAFSSENWQRSAAEVTALMSLFVEVLSKETAILHDQGVSMRFIGDLSLFSDTLQRLMVDATEMTQNNKHLILNIAVNYGGQWDILQAAKKASFGFQSFNLENEAQFEQAFKNSLSLAGLPPVDLCIRTAGEQRISNFLLWDIAYAELYFSQTLWPDFAENDLKEALFAFQRRQRRFGGSGVYE